MPQLELDIPQLDSLGTFQVNRVGYYSPREVIFSTYEDENEKVKNLMSQVIEACCGYMNYEELAKIDLAMALMHYGHQGQTREDQKTPYVNHLLHVALPLASKYQLDWETIASALCHDLLEDSEKNGFPVSKKDLSRLLSYGVSNTVETLSKVRFGAGEGREENVDDVTRGILFEAVRDNPRAAVIKIYDRLHNMETITEMPISKQREKAIETLKYYVTLAQFLGMFEEARELAKLSLDIIDPVFSDKLTRILEIYESRVYQKADSQRKIDNISLLKGKLSEVLEMNKSLINIIIPDIYALYRRMKQKRDPALEDCFLSVDIEIPDEYKGSDWLEYAWNMRYRLAMHEFFDAVQPLSPPQIKEARSRGRLHSLEFFLNTNFGQGTQVKINIYPKGKAVVRQLPITNLYYHRVSESVSDESQDLEAAWRHSLGRAKRQDVGDQIGETVGDPGSSEFGRKFLDFILPGTIYVQPMDMILDRKRWWISEGATVLDYACDRYPDRKDKTYWMNAGEFVVNQRPVAANYVLSPGDTVYIHFDKKPQVKPSWIKAMYTTTDDFKDQVRQYFRKRISQRDNRRHIFFEMLKDEAVARLGQTMGEKLVTVVDKANRALQGMDPDEFITALALDEIPPEQLEYVVNALKAHQEEHVAYINFIFAQDASGQVNAVTRLFKRVKISARLIEGKGGVTSHASSNVMVVLDLSDIYENKAEYPKVMDLINSISNGLDSLGIGYQNSITRLPNSALIVDK